SQVRLLFEQLPFALYATVFNAVTLTAIIWGDVSKYLLAGWLVSVLMVAFVRGLHGRSYLRRNPQGNESQRWSRYYLCGAAANGLLWGAAGYLFFTTESYVHQVLLAFVLIGMTSGGIATLSALPGAFLLFAIPALTPYGVRLLTSGDK